MFNIQKAVSRLNYAPKLKEIRITDIRKGVGVFAPQPDKPVSFAALRETLKKAGYTLDSAEIAVVGTLERDDSGWWLVSQPTAQRFALEGADAGKLLPAEATGTSVELVGDWKTAGVGDAARETISPRSLKQADAATQNAKQSATATKSESAKQSARVSDADHETEAAGVMFANASFDAATRAWLAVPVADSLLPTGAASDEVAASDDAASPERPPAFSSTPSRIAVSPASSLAFAPIRTTSPGLTVFKGGAFTPRLFLVEQHLGGLSVSRQILQLSASYTPSPRVQLEVEAPLVSRTSFDDGTREGSGTGVGNVTLWGKYRFYRTVKTYGDRQAAARVGVELPTGKADAPAASEVNAPAFVRQQLTPISGGFATHLELAFSQAGGRFIFGGDAEGVLRAERDGFRMGHETRVGTDLEYVLLPFKYDRPGHELFLIVETSFVHRGVGRLDGAEVAGSKSTEFYVAPGLQYAAHPRFVIEASVQLPVVRHTGALVLRTDRNILLGVKYLF